MIIFSGQNAECEFYDGICESLSTLIHASDQAIESGVLRGHHMGVSEYLSAIDQAVYWAAMHAFFEMGRIRNRGVYMHEVSFVMVRVYRRLLDSREWDGEVWEIALRDQIEQHEKMLK